MADFLEIVGDIAAAREIAARIYPEAEAMGFAITAERAKELLEDRTLLMRTERDLTQFKQSDEDFYLANDSDESVVGFARDLVQSFGLPIDRLPVVAQCCKISRETARERIRWCRYLEVLEEKEPAFHPRIAYSRLPNHKCVCEKHGHETKTVTPDAMALMAAFKQVYCLDCKDRSPKQP